ncbi:MAG: LLM class flavin-dependent oxidoreductase, partial [Pseudomonadota bacterium]
MIIAQKPWDKTMEDLERYGQVYREVNDGEDPPKPLMLCFVACHDDAATAEEMHLKYLRGYSRSALEHYEFNNEGLADIKGYEYYGGLSKNINKHGIDTFVNFLADLQVWGTPDAVYERMLDYQQRTDCAGFVGAFCFGGMPHELAAQSMSTFAKKVLPRLKALDVGAQVGGVSPRAPAGRAVA